MDSVAESDFADSVGPVWATEYGIVKLILNNLSMRELNKAARVCKTWWKASQVIKKSRTNIYSFFSEIQPFTLRILPQQSDYESEDAAIYQKLQTFLQTIRSSPSLCLAFQIAPMYYRRRRNLPDDNPLYDEVEELLPADETGPSSSRVPVSHKTVLERLKRHLPIYCSLLGMKAPGLVGTYPYSGLTEELEEDGCALGFFLFPNLPDCSIKRFTLLSADLRNLQKELSDHKKCLSSVLGLDSSDQVKCLLLFSNDLQRGSQWGHRICEFVYGRENEQVAIGGGFVDNLNAVDESGSSELHGITGLAFCGEGVTAASVVVPHFVQEPAEVEAMIKKLKERFPVEGKSVAFMFACVARGGEIYDSPNVESGIFRKYYPNTPVLGFFGNGEIGIDHFPQTSDEQNGSSWRARIKPPAKKPKWNFLHGCTTIFVVVSFPGH